MADDDSPTCGLRIPQYRSDNKMPWKEKGTGVWADYLQQQWPELPVTEEGRLNDIQLRETFLIAVGLLK